jgi:hypothetical protein
MMAFVGVGERILLNAKSVESAQGRRWRMSKWPLGRALLPADMMEYLRAGETKRLACEASESQNACSQYLGAIWYTSF